MPGAYDVTATAVGHEPETKSIIVNTDDATRVNFKLKKLTVLQSLHHQDSEEEAYNLYQMQKQANDQLTMTSSAQGYAGPPLNTRQQVELERPGMNIDHSLLLDVGRPKRSFLNPLVSQMQFSPALTQNNFGISPLNKADEPR